MKSVTKLIIPAVLLLFALKDTSAQSVHLPRFMGHEVTIVAPELDADGFFPKGPASVCIESVPQRQCYSAPKGFGRSPKVTLIQLDKKLSALFFTAASGGVSGFSIYFALLRPGTGKDLEDLFSSDMSVSNQSQHAFWVVPAISAAQIFVTAEWTFGPDEGHYGEHRYMISTYVRRPSSLVDDLYYYLEDRYMTVRRYDLDVKADILTSEKQEILARLRRLKAERERQQRAPH